MRRYRSCKGRGMGLDSHHRNSPGTVSDFSEQKDALLAALEVALASAEMLMVRLRVGWRGSRSAAKGQPHTRSFCVARMASGLRECTEDWVGKVEPGAQERRCSRSTGG